ncbi:hypothetical protein [Sphingomonas quercus]|uniref:Uncharacterized protein n=1 Tax=Sphingomonas quercus TaxID=2842451 RepID=A0ABS6BGH9_9SPHN|nr:hypothetical protein [Sphingomonas quercus]MBU3077399.1 hypothetical protein [Sphingomonas quercus]
MHYSQTYLNHVWEAARAGMPTGWLADRDDRRDVLRLVEHPHEAYRRTRECMRWEAMLVPAGTPPILPATGQMSTECWIFFG